MATVPHREPLRPTLIPAADQTRETHFADGDPQMLGLPIFVVASLALAFSLVGYVPATAEGVIVPVIFAGTGLGLVIATVWAAARGQGMAAAVFGLFAGFWMSYAILLLGIYHDWFRIPFDAQTKSTALFLISWSIVMFALTLATVRLPLAYTILVALLVATLVLRTIGVLNADTTLDKAAGYVAFALAAVGIYLFLHSADTAMGGRGYLLGPPIVRQT
jgi:succinate-acetate transporter protein